MWWLNKNSKKSNQRPVSTTLSLISHAPQSQQHIPIWFIFESGSRIDLNSHVIIEDPRGLYQFLQFRGQHMLTKQLKNNLKITPRVQQPIFFYEKDYRKWRR